MLTVKTKNVQCEHCIHNIVCAHKDRYEDAVKLYESAREECNKYPWFRCKIECVQYRSENTIKSIPCD